MSQRYNVSELVNFYRNQRNIFGVCPHCMEMFRLSEVEISYQQRFKKDWYDKLEEQKDKIETEKMSIEDSLKEIRREAIEKARKTQLPRMLKRADPVFTPLGFYPQDAKAMFDPIDFVIFDGMNREGIVKSVVLMDEYSTDHKIRDVQKQVEEAVHDKKYEFRSVRLSKTGTIDE